MVFNVNRKQPKIFLLIFTFLIILVLGSCQTGPKYAKGTLEITFNLNEIEGIEPSYQTVIWLEDEDSHSLRSFLVSEYLSYGGYNDSTICPNWSKQADWDHVDDIIFDAVTAATPPIGADTLRIDCKKEQLLQGIYNYFIQVHIVEKYNILYKGTIDLSQKRLRMSHM